MHTSQKLSSLAVVAASALALHCTADALEGDTPPAEAADCACLDEPPTFEKLQEGMLHVEQKSTRYETASLDVSGYREVVVRVDALPYYGGTEKRIDLIAPAFADVAEGPFLTSGLPVLMTGGRTDVNGSFLRLRFSAINDAGFDVPYAIYGVK